MKKWLWWARTKLRSFEPFEPFFHVLWLQICLSFDENMVWLLITIIFCSSRRHLERTSAITGVLTDNWDMESFLWGIGLEILRYVILQIIVMCFFLWEFKSLMRSRNNQQGHCKKCKHVSGTSFSGVSCRLFLFLLLPLSDLVEWYHRIYHFHSEQEIKERKWQCSLCFLSKKNIKKMVLWWLLQQTILWI